MNCGATYTFDIPAFRISYPVFANVTKFPDATLQMYWNMATCYISDSNWGWLNGKCRYQALTLMTAHLTALSVVVAGGQLPGIVQSSTIDKITVSLTPPPVPNQWRWWLSTTSYGQALLALLQVNSAGGFYIGGFPERQGFRKVYGVF